MVRKYPYIPEPTIALACALKVGETSKVRQRPYKYFCTLRDYRTKKTVNYSSLYFSFQITYPNIRHIIPRIEIFLINSIISNSALHELGWRVPCGAGSSRATTAGGMGHADGEKQ